MKKFACFWNKGVVWVGSRWVDGLPTYCPSGKGPRWAGLGIRHCGGPGLIVTVGLVVTTKEWTRNIFLIPSPR